MTAKLIWLIIQTQKPINKFAQAISIKNKKINHTEKSCSHTVPYCMTGWFVIRMHSSVAVGKIGYELLFVFGELQLWIHAIGVYLPSCYTSNVIRVQITATTISHSYTAGRLKRKNRDRKCMTKKKLNVHKRIVNESIKCVNWKIPNCNTFDVGRPIWSRAQMQFSN